MQKTLRGVNLGGWLVLEKWITPSLFHGYKAEDEWSFCRELGRKAEKAFEKHRREFITRQDFEWLAERGINAVRIPVGHGIFGESLPYIGAIEVLDFAVSTTKELDLDVIIDLHTVPGSQNGWDHSGRKGDIGWPTRQEYQEESLRVLGKLVTRYKSYTHIVGIEVLNEPHWTVDKAILKDYYHRAYALVRSENYNGKVVIQDGFDPLTWSSFIGNSHMRNVVLDLHLYQCFSDEDKKLDSVAHLHKTRHDWRKLISQVQNDVPVIVGEWSLGLDPLSLRGLSDTDVEKMFHEYACAQLEVFEETAGWFFWTYKTENMPLWSLRDGIQNGWIPDRLFRS